MKSKGKKCLRDAKQIERMRHMLSEGMRHHDIAQAMGVSKSTVSVYLRKPVKASVND